jgi:hypothetical protein
VSNTGTLAIACHGGFGPGRLCINSKYRIRWAQDCDCIWDGDEALDPPDEGCEYFEATIRITSVPDDMNISANQAFIRNYGFDIIEWVHLPDCQATEN